MVVPAFCDSEEPTLPASWVAVVDNASGNTYYHNPDTQDTQWSHPGASAPTPPGRLQWESSDEDDELSSDGERGGDEYANEFCEMPADYDMWGEPGFGPGPYGGGGYD